MKTNRPVANPFCPHHTITALLSILAATLVVTADSPLLADDWPQWGGPQRDLVWREDGIVKTLPKTDNGLLPRMWSVPLNEGYAGPAVANGRVFVMDWHRQQREERLVCVDAADGKMVWEHRWPATYTISYPNGPRCTPAITDGRVYAIGGMGHMVCLAEQTGELLWQKDFVADYGTELPVWGMVATPLVDGDQVITLVGGKGSLVVSFDKSTGRELWKSLDDREVGYAPPVIFEFGGQRQLIVWHPQAVSAVNPADGKLLWEVPYSVRAGLSIATPRQVGNRLFVASFYNGPRMLEVAGDGSRAAVVWSGRSDSEIRTDGVHPIMCIPWFDGTHIYSVCSYGQLRCLDATNGRRLWETFDATGEGRWWNAFLIRHEDRFFIHNEQGDLIIANLTPAGYEELSRAKLVEPTRPVMRRMTIWSHPAFAMRSVFARNDKELVRVDLTQTR